MKTFRRFLVTSAAGLVCIVAIKDVNAQNTCLENSIVTPHMEVPIQADRNIVFCSTFQIAWNTLKHEIIKEDLKLEKPVELLPFLNKGLSTSTDIAPRDYLVMAGYAGDEIVGKINRTLQAKFGPNAPQIENAYSDPTIIVAYAFLNKNLQFQNVFENFAEPMPFYAQHETPDVAGFGIHQDSPQYQKLRDQVEIIDYENQRSFMIRLSAASSDDEIILARIEPEKTLLATFDRVNARVVSTKPERLGKKDILQIPQFDFAVNHVYSSLLGLHLLNKGFEDYFIAEARQDIRFKFNETGATIRSGAKVVLKKGESDFRMLICNRPFLLYAKKKNGQYPYFAVWVANAELMVRHGNTAKHPQ